MGITALSTEYEVEKAFEKLEQINGRHPFEGHAPFLEGLPKLEVLQEYRKLEAQRVSGLHLFEFLNKKREEHGLKKLKLP